MHYTSLQAALAGCWGCSFKGDRQECRRTGEQRGQALRNAIIMTGQEAGRERDGATLDQAVGGGLCGRRHLRWDKKDKREPATPRLPLASLTEWPSKSSRSMRLRESEGGRGTDRSIGEGLGSSLQRSLISFFALLPVDGRMGSGSHFHPRSLWNSRRLKTVSWMSSNVPAFIFRSNHAGSLVICVFWSSRSRVFFSRWSSFNSNSRISSPGIVFELKN